MEKSFRKFGVITVLAVYFLILVGGIVRTTGSGMGCPDWPRCFGQWIPPTDISELPTNYKELFKVQGKEIADFEPFKTWVEYVNRLVGVAIGIFVFITFVFSFGFFRKDRTIFWVALLAFLLVGFQGWLGSVVVSTNLDVLMITLHMLLALVIVAMLIYAVVRSYGKVIFFDKVKNRNQILKVLLACMILYLVQIGLGTQVRESIDHIAKVLGEASRHLWIEQLDWRFYVHRTYSLVLLGIHGHLVFLLYKKASKHARIFTWAKWLFMMLFVETLTGVVMAYFEIPKVLQPIHLLLASLAFGVQFVLLLMLYPEKLLGKKQ